MAGPIVIVKTPAINNSSMHELLANIDDTTYKRIIEDARMKGIEPRDWIRHAVDDFLTRRQSAIKEVLGHEIGTCSPGAVCVHAEVYTPNPDGTSHEIVEHLQRQVRELETERDNLKVLLDQYSASGSRVPRDEAEILTLHCEIEKNAVELDEMEVVLERLRLEKEQILTDPEGTHRIQHIEKEIERQEYGVENFREVIAKLMSTRDTLRAELAKKRKG